jgi:hypothetical protein
MRRTTLKIGAVLTVVALGACAVVPYGDPYAGVYAGPYGVGARIQVAPAVVVPPAVVRPYPGWGGARHHRHDRRW